MLSYVGGSTHRARRVYPLFLFAVRYATQLSLQYERISKPLASMAWFYSLMILNIEYSDPAHARTCRRAHTRSLTRARARTHSQVLTRPVQLVAAQGFLDRLRARLHRLLPHHHYRRHTHCTARAHTCASARAHTHARTGKVHGFAFGFYSFIVHYVLYVALAVCGIVFKGSVPFNAQ